MLRLLEYGVRICGVVADYVTIGVDRPSDVALVESAIQTDSLQRTLDERIRMRGHAA